MEVELTDRLANSAGTVVPFDDALNTGHVTR